jgi:hypothetical protein
MRSVSTKGNLRSGLRRSRRVVNPMAERDRLPAPCRLWLSHAALPWSPHSVGRAWRRALKDHAGDHAKALEALDLLEQRRLRKDAPAVWGLPCLPEAYDITKENGPV